MSTQVQSKRIKIANPPVADEVTAYISSDTAASATSIPVISTTGFDVTSANDYYVLVGRYGDNKAEIKLVDASASSATAFNVAALTYSHETSDIVTLARYNQIQIFGATESGGTKTLIDTIEIDTTENFTEYVYEGVTYSYFYTAYYNSNDDELSQYSDEITASSFGRYSAKRIIESALIKALTSIDERGRGTLTWDTCLSIVQDGLDEIISRKRKWQFLHKISTDSTVANDNTLSIPSDLAYLEFIRVDRRKLDYISRMQFDTYIYNNDVDTTGRPYVYTEKNGEYYLYPTPTEILDVVFEYFKIPTVVDGLSDEVPREFTTTLIYYCASQIAYIRGNDKRGDKMYKMFENQLENQVEEYTGSWQSGDSESAESITILDFD